LGVADGSHRLGKVVCEGEPSHGVTCDRISGWSSYQDQGVAPEIISYVVAVVDFYDLWLAGSDLVKVSQQLDEAEGVAHSDEAGRLVGGAEDTNGDRQVRLDELAPGSSGTR
jgi:hypothetical protein